MKTRRLTPLALLALPAIAAAQPASFTELGVRTSTQTFSQDVTLLSSTNIQWFRVQLPQVTASAGWVDIWTLPATNPFSATDLVDTEIGLYNAAGDRAVPTFNFSDDNDGPGSFSQLSFGSTVARPGNTYSPFTPGNPRAGGDGSLSAGVYYLAVGAADVVFGVSGFNVFSTNGGNRTTTRLFFDISNPSSPTPPSASGAASPSTAGAGDTVTYTVTVLPGTNPASTGLTVYADLSAVGGPGAAALRDDGLDGDAVPGDNVFTFVHVIPEGMLDRDYTVPASVVDAQGRSATATITGVITGPVTWDESADGGGDAGQTLALAQNLTGNDTDVRVITGFLAANDVDMFRINVCDPTHFSATTRFSNPLFDSQLFLFRSDGDGVSMNDDTPDGFPGSTTHASTLDGSFIPRTGNYYLAVSRYNVDPVTPLGTIWADEPVEAVHAPDGSDPTGSLAGWAGTSSPATYRITLTGACFPVRECGAADLGHTGGVPGPDGHLDNNDFIVFIDYFFGQRALADVGSTGGVHGPDQQFDNNDFVVFIDLFFSGASDCP